MTKSIKAQCTTITQKLILKTFTSLAIVNITIPDDKLSNWNDDGLQMISEYNQPVVVHVHVLPCPPGFKISAGGCDCAPSLDHLATCDITNQTIKKKDNSWISPRNDSLLIFKKCPFDYCNNDVFASDYPSEQCNHKRRWTLCGDCLP